MKVSLALVVLAVIATTSDCSVMKVSLALVVLAVIAATSDCSVVKVNSRAILNVGYVSAGDKLLYRSYIYQPAIVNSVQYQDVVYRGNVTTRITGIQANEVGPTAYASAYIVQGGVGQRNVTVRFTSARGYGYYYLLDIWGR